MFDYKLVTTLKSGQIREVGYQRLIQTLGMTEEIVHGRPLTDGGVPQVEFLCSMLMTAIPTIEKIEVLFNGNCILSF